MLGSRWGAYGGMALVALGIGLARVAHAADPKEWGGESAADDDAQPAAKAAAEAKAKAEADAAAAQSGAAKVDGDGAKAEAPAPEPEAEKAAPDGNADYLLGLRYRGLWIPAAVLHGFIDGGKSLYSNGFGPEFSMRNDNVEYVLSAWVALYGMSPVAIKGTSDAEEAWEIVQSKLKAVYFTFDYLWHTRLSGGLDLSYGGGAGLGFLFGALYRTQATLATGGTEGNPNDYVRCTGQNTPSVTYCDDINNHYNGYGEPNWLHGGAKPLVFPWLAGQVGLRYQAAPKFVARLDLGIGTSGLFFGVGADYGL
jgi:hypothetical protein